MSVIGISNLTFSYEDQLEPLFNRVSFDMDGSWKLGLIGRNGRGKTTLLKLLTGRYPFEGSVVSSLKFEYFPFEAPEDAFPTALETAKNEIAPFSRWEREMEEALESDSEQAALRYGELHELYIENDGYIIDALLTEEAEKLRIAPDALERPFGLLSGGEKTKLLLAALFLKKDSFLLLDEPTNHLDAEARNAVCSYLKEKQGFILVSHDRALLDAVTDHILSVNRCGIEVQKGNFSSWQLNRSRQDAFEQAENEKLGRDIRRLQGAAARTAGWSDRIESSKIGAHAPDRGYVGHKSAKMMKRAKTIENRIQKAVEEKKSLLNNIETYESIELRPLFYRKKKIAEAVELCAFYDEKRIFGPLSFTVERGDRIALTGRNGSGKSTLLKLLRREPVFSQGKLTVGEGAVISFVAQDISRLSGSLYDFIGNRNADKTLFLSLLRKLDFPRRQFDVPMEAYSSGQKKKVLLAASLAVPADLYLWDEPFNFIDLFSRIQIEELILQSAPTMVFVEHDVLFTEKTATKILSLEDTENLASL